MEEKLKEVVLKAIELMISDLVALVSEKRKLTTLEMQRCELDIQLAHINLEKANSEKRLVDQLNKNAVLAEKKANEEENNGGGGKRKAGRAS